MYVIGLTGGVGSGKTEAAHRLAEIAGAEILLADELGHLAMEPGTKGYAKIISAFGKEILQEDGSICRNRLAQLVFGNQERLIQLNRIVHPIVKQYLKEYIAQRKEQNGYIVLESAIMFETGCDLLCDEIWYVYVPVEKRKQRLWESRGYSEEKTEQIMGQQLRKEEFERRCQVTIPNESTLESLSEQLKKYFNSIPNCRT